MQSENDKKQRKENSCVVDLPLLCLDMICSYMTGYSLLAVHEAFPLTYSSFLKPLILERRKKDRKLRLLLEHRSEVRTKELTAFEEQYWTEVSFFIFL